MPGTESAGDLAHKGHHRCRILERGVQADRRVSGSRPPSDEAHPRPPAQPTLRIRHKRRAALVTAGDETDAFGMLMKAIEHGQVALAGHAKGRVDALGDQRFDEGMSSESRKGPHGLSVAKAVHSRRRKAVSMRMLCVAGLMVWPMLAQFSLLPGYQHLRGTVGPYAVTMDVDGGSGFYVYDRFGEPIRLHEMCEMYKTETCFTGRQSPDRTFRGFWRDKQSGKSYPVTLRPSVADSPVRFTEFRFSESRTLADGKEQSINLVRWIPKGRLPHIVEALDRDYVSILLNPQEGEIVPVYRKGDTEKSARDRLWCEATGVQSSFYPTVVWNANGILSLTHSTQISIGQDRPLFSFTDRSYDLARDREVTLRDLLAPNTGAQFEAIFQTKVQRKIKLGEIGEPRVPYFGGDSFLMTAKGIFFNFESHSFQADPHVDFFITFAELAPILRPEYRRLLLR